MIKLPAEPQIETVVVSEKKSLREQIVAIRGPLEDAVKRAKWQGGKVAVDASFHIGVLMFLERIAERLESLENAQCAPAKDAPEEEEALVAVD